MEHGDDDLVGQRAADLELVRQVMRGEPAAVERFTARMQCVPRLLAWIDRKAAWPLPPEAFDDLVQDVLVAVWRRLPDYRGEARLEAWVHRFCFLQWRNARRRARRREPAAHQSAEPGVDPRSEITDRLDVAAAMAALAPDEALLLRQKHFDGLTFEAIGALTGISPNTLKTKYYRILQTMARLLDTNRDAR